MDFKGDLFGLKGVHVEVKRTERLNLPKAWRQATSDCPVSHIPSVFHRSSGEEWLCTIRGEDFAGLLREVEDVRENQ